MSLLSFFSTIRFFSVLVVCDEFAIFSGYKTLATYAYHLAHGRNRQRFVLMTLDIIKVDFTLVGHYEPITAISFQFANFFAKQVTFLPLWS